MMTGARTSVLFNSKCERALANAEEEVMWRRLDSLHLLYLLVCSFLA
jgi:hypothetical protein